jgi:hypothetical protein
MPSRRQRADTEISPLRPSTTILIFSSGLNRLRVERLISRITLLAPMTGLLSAQDQIPGTKIKWSTLTYLQQPTCATFYDDEHLKFPRAFSYVTTSRLPPSEFA